MMERKQITYQDHARKCVAFPQGQSSTYLTKITGYWNSLTFPLPSFLVPTPYTKGRGGDLPDPTAISKTIASMNLKFCRVLATSFNVLVMLKLFT